MKKKIIFMVLCLLTCFANSVYASGNEVTNVYADVYGIEINFSSTVARSDYSDFSLTCDGENVTCNLTRSGKSLIVTPNENLQTDVIYTLFVCNVEKKFKIKTVFFEDFNNIADADISSTVINQNSYGAYSVSAGDSGAFFKNGTVGITDGMLKITDTTNGYSLANSTVTADVKGYAIHTFNNGVLRDPRVSSSRLCIYSRGSGDYGKIDAVCGKFSNSNYMATITNENAIHTLAQTSAYPQKDGVTNYAVGTMLGTIDEANQTVTVSKDTLIQTESFQRNIGIRANNATMRAYADGEYVVLADSQIPVAEGNIVFTSEKSVMVIDNIQVTVYEDYTNKRYIEIDESSLVTDDGISFDIALNGDISVGSVYAALYSTNGVLQDVDIKSASASVNISFDENATGSYVKIMWWDSNMHPLSDMNFVNLE